MHVHTREDCEPRGFEYKRGEANVSPDIIYCSLPVRPTFGPKVGPSALRDEVSSA